MNTENQVQNHLVVSMAYTLTVDGEVFSSADSGDPIEFIQGIGNIIPGLESELYGLKVGDSKEVVVAPKDAYGVMDAESITKLPRSEFPADIPLRVGITIEMDDQDGEHLEAVIEQVEDDFVTINFNHPLAGKSLHFSVKIVGLRAASEEELAHQHVH